MLNLSRLGAINDLNRDQAWSAATLAGEIDRRTAELAAHGIGPGRQVFIGHGDSPAFFADLLAVWQRGACAICANPGVSKIERDKLIEFSMPDLVLGGEDGHPRPISADTAAPDTAATPGDSAAALMLFTSGSTGVPKGVVHSFSSLAARLANNWQAMPRAEMARTLCVLPTHFGHGLIGNCLTPLLAGCELNLFTGHGLATAGRLGPVLDARNITFMSSVPAFWRIALKASQTAKKHSLRRVHIGSAPLSATLWQEVVDWVGDDNVVNMYGLTETANWVAGASARDYRPADGLVGRMWGGEVMVDGDGSGGRGDGEGELLLRTPSGMTGYYKQPGLTEKCLRDGWFRTGDIGYLEPDGTIHLTGRLRTEVNRGGIKVHPEEVERLLERHPAIVEACAFALPDAIAGEILGAALCLVDSAAVTEGELRSWCAQRIRREALPDRWFFVPSLAKNDRGKLDRQAVARNCRQGACRPKA